MITLCVGGAHYCPHAKKMFGDLLSAQIPFLYLPYSSSRTKDDYWNSLSVCRSPDAPRTFPAVMLLVDDKPKSWTSNGKHMSDDAISNYLVQHKKKLQTELQKTLTGAKFSGYQKVSDTEKAWHRFDTNQAFVYLPINK